MNRLQNNGVTIEAGPLVQLFLNFLDQAATTSGSSNSQRQAAVPPPDAEMEEIEGSTDEEAEPGQDGKRPNKAPKKVSAAAAADIKKRRITRKTALKKEGQ